MGYTAEEGVSYAQSDSQPLILVDIGFDSCEEEVCWWSAYPIYIEEKNTLLPAPKQALQLDLVGLGTRYLDI